MTTPTDVHADHALHTRAAERLRHAADTRTPCAPIRDLLPHGEDGDPAAQMAFGYAVQRILTEAAVRDGRRVVGSKIGLTAPAVQRQLGVDRPDLGVLYADMARREDETIAIAQLMQPKIEAEVAFVLGADLDRPNLSLEVVRDAVTSAVAALEIVDSRVADWNIRLVDTVADNASCGLYVIGSTPRPLDGLDLPAAAMTMTADGRTVSEGSGSACLGDPCAALLWLARTAQSLGSPLRTGDLVLSGALGPMVAIEPDTTYEATIDGLGTVRASFGTAA
jgi:2-keto-4-pentenoate hydratase